MLFSSLFAALGHLFLGYFMTFPVSQFDPSAATPVSTLQNPQPLRVVTRIVEPFVIEEEVAQNGEAAKYGGYSIKLMDLVREELSHPTKPVTSYELTPEQKSRLDLPLKFLGKRADNAEALVNIVEAGQADLGVASISITQDREDRVDFSLPIFSSALQVMQTTEKAPGPNVFIAIGHILNNNDTKISISIGLAAMFLLANLIYFFERRHPKSFLYGDTYWVGLGNSVWWGITTLVGQEESHPRSGVSRLAAVSIMGTGVVAVSLFTASVASDLTLQRLDDPVRGLESLKGQRIVTVKQTTSSQFLDKKKTLLDIKSIKTLDSVDQAYEWLRLNRADSLVYDAPVLEYYAKHQGKGKFTTVGPAFHTEYYGIVLAQGSPWREPISRALLTLSETGRLDALAHEVLGTGALLSKSSE